jgi:hypothetical protein
MGESEEVIDLKRKELVEELARPIHLQNKDKIRRLKEAINRHRAWEKKRIKARRNWIKNREKRRTSWRI